MMRVSKIAVGISKKLQVDDDTLFQIELGAMLHDIGKLVVPSDLLDIAPKDLGPLGVKVIREHVFHGEHLVQRISDLEIASTFIRSHHERFDGKGYPDKLSGHGIPLGARIIAVANAFDKACYQPVTGRRQPAKQALKILQHNAGSVFDPEIVRVLASIVAQGGTKKAVESPMLQEEEMLIG